VNVTYEYDEGWFFILLRVPYKNTDVSIPFSTVPLGIIFKDDIFVTICFYQTDVLPDFIQFTVKKSINKRDHFDLVLRLMLSSSVWFLKYLKQINQSIKLAETELEQSIKNEDLQALLRIEKVLFSFHLVKGRNILHRIKNSGIQGFIRPELIEDLKSSYVWARKPPMFIPLS
jgi:magnesium transporter